MSSAEYKDWILHVIDQLRRRKARPDLERICHFVQRKYGLNRAETEANIERLVDSGAVVKVHYKRGTSYRNAAKSHTRSYSAQILNSNSTSRKILDAVRSILKEKTEHKTLTSEGNVSSSASFDVVGASTREIDTRLSSLSDDPEQLMCPTHFAIQREVEAGRLARLSNGNYIISTSTHEPQSDGGTVASFNPKLLMKSTSVVSKRGRPPKKKNAVSRSFSCGDILPAPLSLPPQTTSSEYGLLCDFCQQTDACNKQGEPEDLLICKDCSAKAHPSCMEYSPELARRARDSPWQCIDCKTCCICLDPGDADAMLFCDACDKGYHMTCHQPKVLTKPQGQWVCTDCSVEGLSVEEIDESLETHVVEHTHSSDSSRQRQMSSPLDSNSSMSNSTWNDSNYQPQPKKMKADGSSSYPYAAKWTVDEVVEFFQSRGFSEQAEVFKEQEIDGFSLLLMRRSDVLQGLSLKLGPALKIYKHVTRLQTAGSTM